jgi:hypothetical protein
MLSQLIFQTEISVSAQSGCTQQNRLIRLNAWQWQRKVITYFSLRLVEKLLLLHELSNEYPLVISFTQSLINPLKSKLV